MVTLRIPAPPAGLVGNLLGVAGLVTVCLAVAFLTDWRWGMLAGGVCATALAVLSQYAPEAKPVPQLRTLTTPAKKSA